MPLKLKLLLLFIILGLLEGREVDAQDAQFSQYFAAPLYNNPAFTGTAFKNRVALSYRNQWPSIPGSFVTTAASYDTYLPKYNSGVGILFTNDKAGTGAFSSTSASLLYSYQLRFSKNYMLNFGGAAGYVNRNINYYTLTFGDQLQSENLTTKSVDPVLATAGNVNYLDISGGALLYNEISWVGVALQHVTQPNQSLSGGPNNKLDLRVTINGGLKIDLQNPKRLPPNVLPISLYPSVMFRRQGPFSQLDIGSYISLHPLLLGAYYRGIPFIKSNLGVYTNESAVIIAGFEVDNFRAGYSYDINLNGAYAAYQGSHELSIGYYFDLPKIYRLKKKYKSIPCPVH